MERVDLVPGPGPQPSPLFPHPGSTHSWLNGLEHQRVDTQPSPSSVHRAPGNQLPLGRSLEGSRKKTPWGPLNSCLGLPTFRSWGDEVGPTKEPEHPGRWAAQESGVSRQGAQHSAAWRWMGTPWFLQSSGCEPDRTGEKSSGQSKEEGPALSTPSRFRSARILTLKLSFRRSTSQVERENIFDVAVG